MSLGRYSPPCFQRRGEPIHLPISARVPSRRCGQHYQRPFWARLTRKVEFLYLQKYPPVLLSHHSLSHGHDFSAAKHGSLHASKALLERSRNTVSHTPRNTPGAVLGKPNARQFLIRARPNHVLAAFLVKLKILIPISVCDPKNCAIFSPGCRPQDPSIDRGVH
jgi:hypothetical protein